MFFALLLCVNHLTCSYAPEPKHAVNLTEETNACYISAILQALIALQPWREYIFSYPSHQSCIYDKELLAALQKLVQDYAHQSTQVNLQPLYHLLTEKNIIIPKTCGNPLMFLTMLSDQLTSDRSCRFVINLFATNYSITSKKHTKELVTRGTEYAIQLPANSESFSKALSTYFNHTTTDDQSKNIFRISNILLLPRILAIKFPDLPNFSIPQIPQTLDLAKFEEVLVQESTHYVLRSIIWTSPLHLVAYVNHNNAWYLCDNRQPQCSQPADVSNDLKQGYITVYDKIRGTTREYYPYLCFYERLLTPDVIVDSLVQLNASLQLLNI